MNDRHQIIHANGIEFAYFTCGEGPLALCLHGYPDTAHTWRYLMEPLANAGFRAVAPFMRGYAPTQLDAHHRYQSGVLGLDANALHTAFGADEQAVLIGHDWGALGAYCAASLEPHRWRRVVTIAVPPGPVTASAFFAYEQLKMSWYMFFQLNALADMVIAMDEFAFIQRLWQDWSPHYDSHEDVSNFAVSMATPDNVTAALSYYRQTLVGELADPALSEAQSATLALPPQPLLYLHGTNDGCMGIATARATNELLSEPSRYVEVDAAGHFLHLEQPDVVNRHIINFVTAAD